MAITLIINSSSLTKKFALFIDDKKIVEARFEGNNDGYCDSQIFSGFQRDGKKPKSFNESLSDFVDQALEDNFIESVFDVKVVALRVVAPGTFFQKHRIISDEFIKELKTQEYLAFSHVSTLLSEINYIKEFLPQAKIVGISDTAFHISIPSFIRNYSISREDAKVNDIYRFGHHGISVSSVVDRIHPVTGLEPSKAIVCHIGAGVSVTAVKDGNSFDTTAGFSHNDGLIMGSRAGDLDAGAVLALMQKRNFKLVDIQNYVQTQGGLYGLSGETDLRILLKRRSTNDVVAKEALDSFIYRIQKAIGSFLVALEGVDVLVFTATAGERSPVLRSMIIERLSGMGFLLDDEKNDICVGKNGIISSIESKSKIAVIKSDEISKIMKIVNNI